MITKTPKFLYFLIFLIALTAADAWRRSSQQNDFSVNKATSPLRKDIIDINRELSEIKVILKKQQTVMLKLKKQLEEQTKPPVVQSEKMIDLINPDENKMLDKLVNGIVAKPEEEKEKELDELPDIAALAATNVTLKAQADENTTVVELPVVEITPKDFDSDPTNEIKKKQKLAPPKRVTSLPAHTAVPEISIPDKNPDLTSKTMDEKPERNVIDATSLSQTMLSGKKRGVRVTISDVLESYDNNENKTGN